jgi:hypothetical protein
VSNDVPDFVILVTGSRDWPDDQRSVIANALINQLVSDYHEAPSDPLLIHGGARGVDTFADKFWRDLGEVREPEVWRADWATYGRAAGHRRNAEMVNRVAGLTAQGAYGVVLAFPHGSSAGTRGCMRVAQAAGLALIVHEARA